MIVALVLTMSIGGLFLWQIHRSVSTIESSFRTQSTGGSLIKRLLPRSSFEHPDSMTQSKALMELRQGEIYELRGEWKNAQARYDESVTSGGGAPALKKLASMQLQRREFDAARDTIATLKSENPNNDDVLFLEGILALRQGKNDAAVKIFEKKPDAPQSMYGVGLVAIARGDHDAAQASLNRAVQSGDPVIRTFSTTILQAYSDFALFPDGQNIHIQTLLARALAQVNECETALQLVTPVTSVQPKYRDAWIVKGFCEFNTERTQEALASLEQAYALDPEKPEIQYFLARTHAALGDPANAVTFLQYAILNSFKPEKDARELLVDYALELGNTALALEQRRLISESPDSDLTAYSKYIDLAINTNNNSLEALTAAKNALARWPDNAVALTLAGKAALAAGLPEDATSYIERALKIDPTNKDALGVQEAVRKTK